MIKALLSSDNEEISYAIVKGARFMVEVNKEMIRVTELEVEFNDSLCFRQEGISRMMFAQYLEYVKIANEYWQSQICRACIEIIPKDY